MSEPWQHYFHSQRLKLSYWTWGNPSNPPLILVHGGLDHSRAWDDLADSLEKDFFVVACDLRGHGDSDHAVGSHYGILDHVLDLITLIDLLGGSAFVVSHSFGGSISLLAAGLFPDRFKGIISIEGAGPWIRDEDHVLPQRIRQWAERTKKIESQDYRIYPSLEAARDRIQEVHPNFSQSLSTHLAQWGTNAIDGGYVWKFDPWINTRHMMFCLRLEEVEKIWSEITCPVLHLCGDQSTFDSDKVNGRAVDDYFNQSQTITIHDAGHWLHHDQLGQTSSAIKNFLSDLN